MTEQILLVGAGPMAVEYAKVLQAMKRPVLVIGRGGESAEAFREATGIPVFTGGLESWLQQATDIPATAIVCVGEKWLGQTTRHLINRGVHDILVEKPGGFDGRDIREVAEAAQAKNANVYVGYNRRFYASTQKAEQIISEDGGVLSFSFEFTEWGHIIAGLKKEDGVKEEWFLANSTHVIDHAFFLGGKPKEICCFTAGGVEWHNRASIYAGAGITEKGALFSYQANWEAPGRWAVELLTKKHRLIFKPMERLQIQKIGSVATEEVVIDDELDRKFKPGLFRQVMRFLSEYKASLPSIQEQSSMLDYFDQINRANSGRRK
ncbi:Gfo/Idh/MocA family protein [Anaeroselena agilis]|uniref:Gfo/Idh/MocA family oxidoreductase n=1 Tax=Anaeroselena agilis TaxID=3063788 RepID=A0ABU3P464_9FIRM|nr:Gfo/Idh/MocA family oxidoreductase [Selenomonadales bacterium 4137-cl]